MPGKENNSGDQRIFRVVHDLRNPLAIILSNVEYALDTPLDPDISDALTDARRASVRISRLLANLVDTMRMERGAIELKRERVAVGEFFRSLIDELYVRHPQMRFELAECESLSMRVDRDMFCRLVENLLENAVRFTPPEGRIALSASTRDGAEGILLRVGNSGPPVAEKELAEIFAPQAADALPRNRDLGLYFCRLAVEAHGGTIRLSRTPDLPVVFEIELPN